MTVMALQVCLNEVGRHDIGFLGMAAGGLEQRAAYALEVFMMKNGHSCPTDTASHCAISTIDGKTNAADERSDVRGKKHHGYRRAQLLLRGRNLRNQAHGGQTWSLCLIRISR